VPKQEHVDAVALALCELAGVRQEVGGDEFHDVVLSSKWAGVGVHGI
jgi:hypothetical protein